MNTKISLIFLMYCCAFWMSGCVEPPPPGTPQDEAGAGSLRQQHTDMGEDTPDLSALDAAPEMDDAGDVALSIEVDSPEVRLTQNQTARVRVTIAHAAPLARVLLRNPPPEREELFELAPVDATHYELELSWARFDALVGGIELRGAQRWELEVLAQDHHGAAVTAPLAVTLHCEGAGGAACGGACVDLSADAAHCGACQSAVPALAACVDGEPRCEATLSVACEGACVPSSDASCGRCGRACGVSASCEQNAYCGFAWQGAAIGAVAIDAQGAAHTMVWHDAEGLLHRWRGRWDVDWRSETVALEFEGSPAHEALAYDTVSSILTHVYERDGALYTRDFTRRGWRERALIVSAPRPVGPLRLAADERGALWLGYLAASGVTLLRRDAPDVAWQQVDLPASDDVVWSAHLHLARQRTHHLLWRTSRGALHHLQRRDDEVSWRSARVAQGVWASSPLRVDGAGALHLMTRGVRGWERWERRDQAWHGDIMSAAPRDAMTGEEELEGFQIDPVSGRAWLYLSGREESHLFEKQENSSTWQRESLPHPGEARHGARALLTPGARHAGLHLFAATGDDDVYLRREY